MSRGSKGGNFEREFSKELSLWWTGGERDDIFWRTAGSGARATTRMKQGKKTSGQCGDITATDPIGFPLIDLVTIELKKGYNEKSTNGWTIKEFIDSQKEKPLLKQFIEQSLREREEEEVECWWLITKQDYKETLLFFDKSFKEVLLDIGIKMKDFEDYMFIHCHDIEFYVVKWKVFKELCDPESIKQLMKEEYYEK